MTLRLLVLAMVAAAALALISPESPQANPCNYDQELCWRR